MLMPYVLIEFTAYLLRRRKKIPIVLLITFLDLLEPFVFDKTYEPRSMFIVDRNKGEKKVEALWLVVDQKTKQ